MRFPLVLRSQHDEVVALYRERVAALEKELYRIKDHIFQKTFGVQLHDSLPVVETSAPAAPATPSVPEPEAPDPEEASDQRRLAAIRRTRPSQLGSEMARIMQRRTMRMARAAFPKHTVPATPAAGKHPAAQLFENAKREALS